MDQHSLAVHTQGLEDREDREDREDPLFTGGENTEASSLWQEVRSFFPMAGRQKTLPHGRKKEDCSPWLVATLKSKEPPQTFVPKILASWYPEWANCKGFLEPKSVN